MTITIYELLGLVKDGKAPRKIKYNDEIYIFNKDSRFFNSKMYKREKTLGIYLSLDYIDSLNDTIEILEEENKIEKLDYCKEHLFDNNKTSYLTIEERRLLDSNFKTIKEKFDEIINEINKLKEDK